YCPKEIPVKVESVKMDVELERLSKELAHLNNKFDEAYNACINATARPDLYIQLQGLPITITKMNTQSKLLQDILDITTLGTKFDQKNIDALKVIEKVATIDHMDKIFEPENVKGLDEKDYTKEALDDEPFGSLKKNYKKRKTYGWQEGRKRPHYLLDKSKEEAPEE
ncbi:19366_t:CDS:2, partial [Gigaspora margarita]